MTQEVRSLKVEDKFNAWVGNLDKSASRKHAAIRRKLNNKTAIPKKKFVEKFNNMDIAGKIGMPIEGPDSTSDDIKTAAIKKAEAQHLQSEHNKSSAKKKKKHSTTKKKKSNGTKKKRK